MRKYLLFVFAAISALSANAQTAKAIADNSSFKSVVFGRIQNAPKKLNGHATVETTVAAKDMSALKAKIQKAPALTDIYGTYIEDADVEVMHECDSATITEYKDPEDGKTYVNITFAQGWADIIGTYDAETGIINCGPQYCGSYDKYGKFAIYGFTIDEQDNINLSEELSFQVNEDKSLSLIQENYIILMPEYTEQPNAIWLYSFEPSFYRANGRMYESTVINGEWTDVEYPIFIEDYEFSVNVYNFLGISSVSMDINDDLTVSLATGQNVTTTPSSADKDIYGDYIYICGVAIEGQQIKRDYDATEIKGQLIGNNIIFDTYYALTSDHDADGAAYGSWHHQPVFSLTEGNFIATGIKEVTATREEMVKNAKTYNIMGQQVNRATKGLVIRNGKKFLNK